MPARKVVGRAVADKRGHYPNAEGVIRVIQPGDSFDLVEGLTKSKWFTALPAKAEGKTKPAKTDPGDIA